MSIYKYAPAWLLGSSFQYIRIRVFQILSEWGGAICIYIPVYACGKGITLGIGPSAGSEGRSVRALMMPEGAGIGSYLSNLGLKFGPGGSVN